MNKFNLDNIYNIPAEMRELNRWVCWNTNKIPINPKNGQFAQSTNPETWGAFQTAINFYEANQEHINGVGYVFAPRPDIIGIDLDKCVNEDGIIQPWAEEIINSVQSYTEFSPSRTGLHIYCKSSLPFKGKKKDQLEIYRESRFFTVTGECFAFSELRECSDEIKKIIQQHFNVDVTQIVKSADSGAFNFILSETADINSVKFEVLKEIDKKFERSWNRERTDLDDSSASGYDLSLAAIATNAGWEDQEIIDLLIASRRKHGDNLKLNRPDYYNATLNIVKKNKKTNDLQEEIIIVADPENNDHKKTVNIMKERFGIPIKRFVKTGRAQCVYNIELDDGTPIQLGNAEKFRNQEVWRNIIQDQCSVLFPTLKKKEWEQNYIMPILRACEIDNSDDTDDLRVFESYLERYLVNIHNSKDGKEEVFEAFIIGKPYKEDGFIYLNSNDFRTKCRRNYGENYKPGEIVAFLKSLNFEHQKLTKREGQKVATKSYWRKIYDNT